MINHKDIDSDPSRVYIICVYKGDQVVGVLAASTYEIVEELIDLVMDDDDDVDTCAAVSVKMDTIIQNETLH